MIVVIVRLLVLVAKTPQEAKKSAVDSEQAEDRVNLKLQVNDRQINPVPLQVPPVERLPLIVERDLKFSDFHIAPIIANYRRL